MSRRRKDPLRPLIADERIALTRLSRSPSAPAAQVERARALLAIADGASYTAAAHQVGRRHTETISAWVSRFNREGLAAVRPGHGVPLYTPVGGSWLNMAASIERVLKRRALDGQHPCSPEEIGNWFEQTARGWNEQPTPFVWNGKRRQRRRSCGDRAHRLGGSGACTYRPLPRNRVNRASLCQTSQQMTH